MAKLPRFTKGLCQAAGASSKWISSPLISFFQAVMCQSSGCFDPFPLRSQLGRVLHTDSTKPLRPHRILSML